MVRHLLVIYSDLAAAANTRSQTDALCSALSLLPALTDLRVRADDLWTQDWIAIFQAFVSRIVASPFKLNVIHVPSSWLVGDTLENALHHHQGTLRTIALCGGNLDCRRIATAFDRPLRYGAVKIFAYERTNFKKPYDALELYPALYLGAADWAAAYFRDVVSSFTDAAPCALEPWQLCRPDIHLLALHFRESKEVALAEPLVRLVQSAFPKIRSIEINGPVGVVQHPRLDAQDVAAAVRPFPQLRNLSLGSWTFGRENLEELREVLRCAGCRNIRQFTLPDGSLAGAVERRAGAGVAS